MSGRRTTSRTTTGTVPRAAPYDVACACGRQHTGIRESDYQVLECDACGRRLFVLPVCPYPEIDEPPLSKMKGGPSAGNGSQPKRRQKKANRSGKQRDKKNANAKRKLAARANPVGTQTVRKPAAAVTGLTVPRRKIVTPLRLVIVGIVIVLAGTGFWQYRQSVLAQAERDFREQADLGDAALKDHDFTAAYAAYRKAVAALDTLGRDDEKSRHVRQMFRESQAASELASKSLPEIAEDVQAWSAADPNDASGRFRSNYAGRWIVLNTEVRRLDDGVRLEFLLTAGNRPVDLLVSGTAFDSLKLDDKPARVILAAEFSACELVDDRWVIRFNPETAFLWTDFENYRALGFTVAPEPQEGAPIDEDDIETERNVRDRLLKQAKLMGLTE